MTQIFDHPAFHFLTQFGWFIPKLCLVRCISICINIQDSYLDTYANRNTYLKEIG